MKKKLQQCHVLNTDTTRSQMGDNLFTQLEERKLTSLHLVSGVNVHNWIFILSRDIPLATEGYHAVTL